MNYSSCDTGADVDSDASFEEASYDATGEQPTIHYGPSGDLSSFEGVLGEAVAAAEEPFREMLVLPFAFGARGKARSLLPVFFGFC
jgi:hypothetical protein